VTFSRALYDDFEGKGRAVVEVFRRTKESAGFVCVGTIYFVWVSTNPQEGIHHAEIVSPSPSKLQGVMGS
jgi:hypothetical protein